VKVEGFTVKFVKVCEWFDRCDKLKIIFKWGKNKITKLYFILKKNKKLSLYNKFDFRRKKILKCIKRNKIFY